MKPFKIEYILKMTKLVKILGKSVGDGLKLSPTFPDNCVAGLLGAEVRS